MPVHLFLLGCFLQHLGKNPTSFQDGQTGFQTFRRFSFHLTFSYQARLFELTQKLLNYPTSNCTTKLIGANFRRASRIHGQISTTIDAVNATMAVADKGKFFKSDCHNYTSILVLLFSMAVSRFGKSFCHLPLTNLPLPTNFSS